MFNYKIFIFNELNYLLLPIAIFQKIIGREVYFLRLTKSWQNEKSIKFFQFIGLKWLNFQDYKIEKIAIISREVVLLQKKFGDFMDNFGIANDLKKKLLSNGCDANDLKSLALARLAARIREFCEAVAFVDYLKENNKNNFIIIGQFPDFFNEIFREKIKNKALFLNFYSFDLIFLVLKVIKNKFILFIKRLFIAKKSFKNLNNNNDLKKYNTVFFPHQGVYYGSLYKKDQFYSDKNNSNFYPSNILHLSIGDQDKNNKLTKEYYRKKNIIDIDFVSLAGLSLKEIISETLAFTKKYYFRPKNSFQSIFFFLNLWLSIKRSLLRLKVLPNVKVAIFGYDLVSPREIAIACKMRGIKTIATQERLICGWDENSFFVFDHYLVINKDIEKHMIEERLGSIRKVKSIGPIRSDLIDMRGEDENIVLVLDFSSNPDFYKNGRNESNNWRQNYIFYDNILKLANKNKNIKFVIKGKNYDFVNIPYFDNIKSLIREISNVKLYEDKNNSPYELIKKTKLTIARYTSLVDELLFKERPVIIYGTGGYPSTFYYDENLIVKNYEELEIKFNKWKEDSNKFNENIVNESRKYFPNKKTEVKVHNILHSYLEKEFKYYS